MTFQDYLTPLFHLNHIFAVEELLIDCPSLHEWHDFHTWCCRNRTTRDQGCIEHVFVELVVFSRCVYVGLIENAIVHYAKVHTEMFLGMSGSLIAYWV